MDDQSFRASVFAEQKQVSAFSDVTADKRRELVLRLLGITPLDKARDLARADARENKKLHDALAQKLPDPPSNRPTTCGAGTRRSWPRGWRSRPSSTARSPSRRSSPRSTRCSP
jgi:hypothetical protein